MLFVVLNLSSVSLCHVLLLLLYFALCFIFLFIFLNEPMYTASAYNAHISYVGVSRFFFVAESETHGTHLVMTQRCACTAVCIQQDQGPATSPDYQ
jgi:hypothetical protein